MNIMASDQIFLNLAYILMLAALLVQDILWLRCILVMSQTCFIAYALLTDNFSMTGWNVLFIAINAGQVIRLFWVRKPVVLPADLEDIYQKVFSVMRRGEFLYFWETGKIREVADEIIIREGSRQTELSMIVQGAVVVGKSGKDLTRLTRGSFIAEMSFLTEEPAAADVRADGPAVIISWDQRKLANLKQVNRDLLIKLQAILGKDLTRKLKDISRQKAAGV